MLQTWQWGELKSRYGWSIIPKTWQNGQGVIVAAALILKKPLSFRNLKTGYSIFYIPRGPLLDWSDSQLVRRVLDDLQVLTREHRAVFLKLDPELVVGRGVPGSDNATEEQTGTQIREALQARSWVFSRDQIQFRNTVWLDLDRPLDDILASFKQKTRYNIRLAERKDVQVRRGSVEDYELLYKMYAETSIRDGFAIRSLQYYTDVWKSFSQAGMLDILIANYEEKPIAALFLFHHQQNSWYLYGMSKQDERERMPNYLLQWEAIKLAKQLGCTRYDLWGAPDIFVPGDSMWGVYRFKEGFNGEVVRTLGAWDFVPNKMLYKLYTHAIPTLLNYLRARGRKQVSRELAS